MQVSGTLASLINGVSQQPDALRLPSQLGFQEDAWGDLSIGLGKRPNSNHIAVLAAAGLDATQDGVFCHFFDIGASGKYLLTVVNGSLRVFDLNGVEKTVSLGVGVAATDAAAYLASGATAEANAFRAVTVGDSVLLLNRTLSMTYATGAFTNASDHRQHLVTIIAGAYSTDYKVTVTATVWPTYVTTVYSATKTTSDTLATDIKTAKIATDLTTALTALAIPGVTFTSYDNVIYVANAAGTLQDLQVQVSDSKGNTMMSVVSTVAQRVSDLPTYAPAGFNTIKIIGEDAGTPVPYYVKFSKSDDNGLSTIGKGVWVETFWITDKGDNIKSRSATPDYRTGVYTQLMPYRLTYSAGTFTFAVAPWTNRVCGDDTSDPNPLFNGKKITDIFLYKNRLGFVADNTITFSAVKDIYQLYRSTVTTVLDSDPIGVSIAHQKSSNILAAVPFQNTLAIFTATAQFVLTDDTLTPKTIGLTQVSEYAHDGTKPITNGSALFFPFQRKSYAGLREYSSPLTGVSIGSQAEAADVTAHVPQYIAGNIIGLQASPKDDAVILWTDTANSPLYVYKYLWNGDRKIQSSWSKFTFGSTALIHGASFINNELYLVITRPGAGTCLERISLAAGEVDAEGPYLTLLDRRISNAACTVAYNAATDITTWTLPYTTIANVVACVRTTLGAYVRGQVLELTGQTSTTFSASGNLTTLPLYIGVPYTMRWRFSGIYQRDQEGTVINDGRLQLRTVYLRFYSAGYFTTSVTPKYRPANTNVYNGPLLSQEVFGAVELVSGVHPIVVLCKNEDATIEVLNDGPFPSYFLSATWTGEYSNNRKGR